MEIALAIVNTYRSNAQLSVDRETILLEEGTTQGDPGPGGHEVLFAATSDSLPSHPTKDGEPQTAVSP